MQKKKIAIKKKQYWINKFLENSLVEGQKLANLL